MEKQVRQRYVDPIIYKVGVDITNEQYADMLVKIGDWLKETRKTKETGLLAQQLIQECLDGKKADGTPWFTAANSTLAARIRVKCRYDIVKMEPMRSVSEKNRIRKKKENEKKLKKRLAENDNLIPDEIRKVLRKDAKYGDDPSLWMTSDEDRKWKELYEDYKTQHPELGAISTQAELKMLCDAHILMERFRVAQMAGKNVSQEELDTTVKRYTLLKKSLGIHPDQIKNKIKGMNDASIGEAVARFQAMGDTYKELRERYWIEELVQAYQMFNMPRADGKGYQLDEVGLFGLTRTKPERCPKCDTMVFGGLDIKQIEEYIIRKGALVEVVDEDEDGNSAGANSWYGVEDAGRAEDRGGESDALDCEVATLSGHSPSGGESDSDSPTSEDDAVHPESGDTE